jgi:hypothetical protein
MSTRGWLYFIARAMGDAKAVSKGPVAIEKRIVRRMVGKAVSRGLWRLFR